MSFHNNYSQFRNNSVHFKHIYALEIHFSQDKSYSRNLFESTSNTKGVDSLHSNGCSDVTNTPALIEIQLTQSVGLIFR